MNIIVSSLQLWLYMFRLKKKLNTIFITQFRLLSPGHYYLRWHLTWAAFSTHLPPYMFLAPCVEDFVRWHQLAMISIRVHAAKLLKKKGWKWKKGWHPIWCVMRHCNSLSLTWTDLKLPQTSKHFLARVSATFSRCGLLRKPTPSVLVVENTIMSFSCPWYESIVFTWKLYEDSSGDVLRPQMEINSIFNLDWKCIVRWTLDTHLMCVCNSVLCVEYGVIIPYEYCFGSAYRMIIFIKSIMNLASPELW